MANINSSQQETDQKIVDFSFYLIQRGEAGHRRGAYLSEYGDSGGIRTIGYGTVTEAGYNNLNYRSKTVTEEQAVSLAKTEMQHKLYEKCRTKFQNFDQLLPCYQAVILDTAYQGQWTKIVQDFNAGNMQNVYQTLGKNPNKERAAVRTRAIEMGMMIEQIKAANPNANPEEIAKAIAQKMIEKYGNLNGTDLALTKDELALMYRSCFAAYGMDVTDEQVEAFAMSYPNVATGMQGIGSDKQSPQWTASTAFQPTNYTGQTVTSSSTASQNYNIQPNYPYGRGPLIQTPKPTRGVPRRSLRDNYPLQPGWGVKPIESNIPEQRYTVNGEVQYNRTYNAHYQSNRSKKPNMIVIHSTEEGVNSNLTASAQYLSSQNDRKVSAHIVIARDGTPYMLVHPDKKANHAGKSVWACSIEKKQTANGTEYVVRNKTTGHEVDLNGCSIGIEIARPTNKGYTREQAATVVAVVGQLAKAYNIPPERVLGHDEIAPGRKSDPGIDFNPIWDALAKSGVALPAAVHNQIRRQIGNAHAVHADKTNPELANVRAGESIAYVPPHEGDETLNEEVTADSGLVCNPEHEAENYCPVNTAPGVPIPDGPVEYKYTPIDHDEQARTKEEEKLAEEQAEKAKDKKLKEEQVSKAEDKKLDEGDRVAQGERNDEAKDSQSDKGVSDKPEKKESSVEKTAEKGTGKSSSKPKKRVVKKEKTTNDKKDNTEKPAESETEVKEKKADASQAIKASGAENITEEKDSEKGLPAKNEDREK